MKTTFIFFAVLCFGQWLSVADVPNCDGRDPINKLCGQQVSCVGRNVLSIEPIACPGDETGQKVGQFDCSQASNNPSKACGNANPPRPAVCTQHRSCELHTTRVLVYVDACGCTTWSLRYFCDGDGAIVDDPPINQTDNILCQDQS